MTRPPPASVRARCAHRLLALCLLTCATPSAWAIEGVETPGLKRAVEAAWQRSVEGRRAEGESLRADADRRIARSLVADAPSLSLLRNEGDWYGGTRAGTAVETEVGISLPLWMPGQRKATMEAARADVDWAVSNLGAARLEVAGRVREAAWDVASRKAELDLAVVRVDFLKKLADDVDRRVAGGELARTDALSARADLLAVQAEAADAQRRLHASQAQWRVLTGLEEMPDAKEIENESHVDAETLLAGAGSPPALAAAEHAVRRAQGQFTAARRSLGAAPELTLGAKEEADAPGMVGDRSLTVELSIPLGVGARRDRARALARTELDMAEAGLELVRSRHAADLEEARLAITLADQQLDSERQRAQLLAERVRLMQRAFSAGEIDLAALLLTSRYSAEAEADLARRHAEHGLAHARLLQVIGMLP